MSQSADRYTSYKKRKEDLVSSLKDSRSIFSDLKMLDQERNAGALVERVNSDNFRVMVIGQFKVGKSTFINALLESEVLPAYSIPCTAVINEIKWGEKRQAILHFKNPLPKSISPDIPVEIQSYIEKYQDNTIPPISIPVDALEDYVVIPDPAKDQKESIAESPYEKVELYWDLELCRNGVEIIDSPGLNENIMRTKVTVDYLSKADAILFVMNCQALCGETEMDFIENNLLRNEHEYVFFINNRINQIVEKERPRLKKFGNRVLSSKTKFGEKGVFYINAFAALEGREKNTFEKVENSGIIEVENLLSDFLTNQRGQVKLAQPARSLSVAIKEALDEVIPEEKKLLDMELGDIQQRYEALQPKLKALEHRKGQISKRIENRIVRIGLDLRRVIENNFNNIVDNTPGWVNEIEVTNSFRPMSPESSATKIIQEILNKYERRLEQSQLDWGDQVLSPIVNEKLADISEEFQISLDEFYDNLESIRLEISGSIDKGQTGLRKVSTIERIGAATIGLLAGNVGSGYVGASFGFTKELLKQIALQIAAVTTMLIVGITNPVTFIPVVIGIAIVGTITGKAGMMKKLKQTVAYQIVQAIRKESRKATNSMTKEIQDQIRALSNPVFEKLQNEIDSVKQQIEGVLAEKMKGQEQVEKRKITLSEHERNLQRIEADLNAFTVSLLQP